MNNPTIVYLVTVLYITFFLLLLSLPFPFVQLKGRKTSITAGGDSLLDRSWFLALLALLIGAILSVDCLVTALTDANGGILSVITALLGGVSALLFAAVWIARFQFFAETRLLSARKLLSHRTRHNLPHERITLRTDDGVIVKGVHLKRGHEKVIVYVHAGFRSKDTLASVMITEWLLENYDVIAIDLRGHGESGGAYTGDGKTLLDYRAALDYARKAGYTRIGAVGRSVGAWTVVLAEAQERRADSVVAAALPYGFISECPPLTPIWRYFVQNRVGNVIARAARAIRAKPHHEAGRPELEIQRLSPTPLLMVYCHSDRFLGMTHEDILRLYSKAEEPKAIHFMDTDGSGHVYEVHLLHKYYSVLLDWFGQTL